MTQDSVSYLMLRCARPDWRSVLHIPMGVLHMQDTAKPLFFSDLSTEDQDKAWEQVFKAHT
jgi:hypothetical protein